jgi:hypothetical protein
MIWGNSTWLMCDDVHPVGSSFGHAHYVEFYTSRGDCWDISGAAAYYEP